MSKTATREAYGKALASLISKRQDIIVLDADLSKSTKTSEAKAVCPTQHFNMGIAEANMMGVAAGLAASGKTVFASSFAMFAAGRAYEQIRNSIAYPKLNVKICATHAGLAVGEDGASHQCIEDLALMRVIPNMVVIQPCDDIQTQEVIKCIADYQGPCYVRLGRSAVEDVYETTSHFQIGKGNILKKGTRIAIIASGAMVQEAIHATQDMDITLVDMPCIKPIDDKLILELAKTHEYIITCEEHNIIGGLGSAIAEVLAPCKLCKQIMIGVKDSFGESGKPAQLFEKYGIDAASIRNVIQSL